MLALTFIALPTAKAGFNQLPKTFDTFDTFLRAVLAESSLSMVNLFQNIVCSQPRISPRSAVSPPVLPSEIARVTKAAQWEHGIVWTLFPNCFRGTTSGDPQRKFEVADAGEGDSSRGEGDSQKSRNEGRSHDVNDNKGPILGTRDVDEKNKLFC